MTIMTTPRRPSNYDKFPAVAVPHTPELLCVGTEAVTGAIAQIGKAARVVVIDCYPGTLDDELLALVRTALPSSNLINTLDLFKSEADVRTMVWPDVTDDAVFGRMTRMTLIDFFDQSKLQQARDQIKDATMPFVVFGVGAALVATGDSLIYADLARWEIQRRQRNKLISNLGVSNPTDGVWKKYKWAYFVDWRVADDHKQAIWNGIRFFLDTNVAAAPKLIDAASIRIGLAHCVTRPFRVVPFFDPGVWGGQWMKDVCDLPRDPTNYAWCFDCVPEENSLLLRFGETRIEVPSIWANPSSAASVRSSPSVSTSSTLSTAATSRSKSTRSPSTSKNSLA
jgi:hypothetical protein